MSIGHLIEPIQAGGGTLSLPGAAQWMQGRTLYGGASALIAYTAATRSFPGLPPLRAAQIGFVAPVGTDMKLRCEMIRQGRNVAQLRSEILCDGKVALTAFWLFGTQREANGRHSAAPLDGAPGVPEDGANAVSQQAPGFLTNNYEVRYTADRVNAGEPVVRRWVRLREPSRLDPVSEIILMGDTLPPSAVRLMERRGPISSINWSFNLLEAEPHTRDGWWLAETASDHADHGYSSERLRMWNTDGTQVTSGIQSVAIFG